MLLTKFISVVLRGYQREKQEKILPIYETIGKF